LLDGRGVCSGYSRAFMMMAQEADIPALYVSSEQMNHGWNYVYDGSSWRYIDVTWDDPLPDQGMIAQDTFLWMSEQDFLNEGSHQLRLEEQEIIKQIAKAFFSF
jgi:transglutaminase/protease-like cytokinesis protein 3